MDYIASMANTLIIGAGPAGIAMAGRLKKAGIPFDWFEQSANLAHSWRGHYDRLHLHTVKKYSHLPHQTFPEHYPKFVSRDQFIAYMEDYTHRFNIAPELNKKVSGLTKNNGSWMVETTKDRHLYKQVIVATGVNRKPHIPAFEGQEQYKGGIQHSRTYKNPNPYLNKKVLVVGMGNTGAEIALDLSNAGIETGLVVRSAVNMVPLQFLGRATQESALLLEKLPLPIAKWISGMVQRLSIGNMEEYGIQKPALSAVEQLGQTGQTPVIDLGTAKAIKEGKIQVFPGIEEFREDEILFADGRMEHYHEVILCTGYRSALQDFIPEIDGFLDENSNPKHCIGAGTWEGLYFPGFDLFKTGGILGVIYQETARIAEEIKRKTA